MKRSALIASIAAGMLALPAAAAAKPVNATVLKLDRRHHHLRVVLKSHTVRSFRYSGKIRGNVRAGSRIAADRRGKTLRHVRAAGQARVLRFYGRVVRDGKRGLVLKVGDGKQLTLGRGKGGVHARLQAASASNPISISIVGLQPGQTVLVTITFGSAGLESITIQLVAPPTDSGNGAGNGDQVTGGDDGTIDDNNGEDYFARGTVTAVDASAGTLEIDTADGHLVFTADSDTLDGIAVGDTVELRYAKDTSTGDLIADDVWTVGDSTGDNAGDGSDSGNGDQPGSGDNAGSGDNSGSGDGEHSGTGDQPPAGDLHTGDGAGVHD